MSDDLGLNKPEDPLTNNRGHLKSLTDTRDLNFISPPMTYSTTYHNSSAPALPSIRDILAGGGMAVSCLISILMGLRVSRSFSGSGKVNRVLRNSREESHYLRTTAASVVRTPIATDIAYD